MKHCITINKKYQNESTALERSVMNHEGGGGEREGRERVEAGRRGCGVEKVQLALRDPDPSPSASIVVKHIFVRSVWRSSNIHESLRATSKSQIKPIMKQRCRLSRNNVSRHLEILWLSNNTTGILEQKQTTSRTPVSREKDIIKDFRAIEVRHAFPFKLTTHKKWRLQKMRRD